MTSRPGRGRTRIIGLGQDSGGDDGVGLEVARALRALSLPDDVDVHATADPSDLLLLLDPSEVRRAVLIDAVMGGGAAGEVVALAPERLADDGLVPLSSHGLGVAQALRMVRAQALRGAASLPEAGGGLPAEDIHIEVVGICVERVERGSMSLSREVRAAVPRAVARVARLVDPRLERLGVTARGVVQGVGFRPFVYRAALERELVGWVLNGSAGVRIEVEGPASLVGDFVTNLREHPPPQAVVAELVTEPLPLAGEPAFTIRESVASGRPRPSIPADMATCADCLEEIHERGERREGYPFTNCTNCGPRYSIIEGVPYDRPRTSMKGFPMCPACEAEYRDPLDRRFHAQPIACPACGPSLLLLDAEGRRTAERHEALEEAARALREGRIVALKGIGGYQLLVDATDSDAVARLRVRKRREAKPFAVMVPTVEAARRWCELSDAEEQALRSVEAPILLLRRRAAPPPEGPDLAPEVAPGNPRLGVMVPYSPLHHLLMERVGLPVVCTSGNLTDEPICITNEQALDRLRLVADVFLAHDRPVVRPVDDSVARVTGQGLQLLRRARGFAPLPVGLPFQLPPMLAVGAHLKSTMALALGKQAFVSQHLGDLDDADCRSVFERTVGELLAFFELAPEAVACDLHPDYATTRLAEELSRRWEVPLLRVQHHHAHVASVMAEHGLDGSVLGLAWDGTGYGTDHTIWGGEALRFDEAARVTRAGFLRPFRLPGGEVAIREPRRSALGLLHQLAGGGDAEEALGFTPPERRVLAAMLDRGVNAPRTSSIGRLFDAVAALVGLGERVRFEGEAAMALEFALREGARRAGAYALPLGADGQADWEPMLRDLLQDRACGVEVSIISARFHNALVDLGLAWAERAAAPTVVLSGGCFQNMYLAEAIRERLVGSGFEVRSNRRVPPNDGCISLGQLWLAGRAIVQRAGKEDDHVPGDSG